MNFSRILFFTLSITAVLSCSDSHTFSEYRDISGLTWSSADTLTFDFDIPQTGSYVLALSARHRKDYEFSNLWVQVALKGVSIDTGFRFEMALFNPEGRPYGECTGSSCTQTIPVKGIGQLQKGKYTVSLVQLMRKDPLDGVQNVGLIIDPK